MNNRPHPYTPPHNDGLDIIYQDDDILVLNKPAGLLAVPGRGADKQDCLSSRVQSEYPEALIIHRLDMDTSGLMLMARNAAMQAKLGLLFEHRQIDKRYIAIVAGKLEQQHGEIKLPLITDWPNRPKQKVDHETGKPSLTFYKVLAHNAANQTSRVELTPQTGRSHQLRVHMQAIGHPILGDNLYASDEIWQKSDRLLLHAERLIFCHPATGEQLKIENRAIFNV